MLILTLISWDLLYIKFEIVNEKLFLPEITYPCGSITEPAASEVSKVSFRRKDIARRIGKADDKIKEINHLKKFV